MKREELFQVAKPILFNTEMVRAIIDGRKTVTRRCVRLKYDNTHHEIKTDKYGTRLIEIEDDVEGVTFGRKENGHTWRKIRGYIEPKQPYKKGDILYVREAFCPNYFDEIIAGYRTGMRGNRNAYKADYRKEVVGDYVPEPKWRPSIHMPKEAARIFLKVTHIRVERLQEITEKQAELEGINGSEAVYDGYVDAREKFEELWNSTIRKSELGRYGWDANPWVWVIEFEKVVEE